MKEPVDWLHSLLYPEHAGTMLKNAPHRVLLLFGDLYPGVLCVVRQVKARFFHMFDRDSLLPCIFHFHAKVAGHSIEKEPIGSGALSTQCN